MKAILLLPLLVTSSLLAMDFKAFKTKAIQNSNRLKSAALSIEATEQKGEILQRYENPTLSLQGTHFDTKNLKIDKGWSLGISQDIRLPALGYNLSDLAKAEQELSHANYIFSLASFTKNLEILYSEYVYQTKLSLLIQEELDLATRLENITISRLKSGFATKAQRMLATLEKKDIQNRLQAQRNHIQRSYFSLLSFSDIQEEPTLEANFIYPLTKEFQDVKSKNPTLLKISKAHLKATKEIDVASHNINSFELFGEYEQEPDVEIGRIGVAINIPLFNRHQQERELAKISTTQSALKLQRAKRVAQLEIKSLKNTLLHFSTQYHDLKNQQQKQQSLLRLFEEGYKISKGSLFELIAIKNSVISKQKRSLQIQKESNLKQIELHFIQGKYND